MTTRICPGCRSLDGEHTFGPTCTLVDPVTDRSDPVAVLREHIRILSNGSRPTLNEDAGVIAALVELDRRRAVEERLERAFRKGWVFYRMQRDDGTHVVTVVRLSGEHHAGHADLTTATDMALTAAGAEP